MSNKPSKRAYPAAIGVCQFAQMRHSAAGIKRGYQSQQAEHGDNRILNVVQFGYALRRALLRLFRRSKSRIHVFAPDANRIGNRLRRATNTRNLRQCSHLIEMVLRVVDRGEQLTLVRSISAPVIIGPKTRINSAKLTKGSLFCAVSAAKIADRVMLFCRAIMNLNRPVTGREMAWTALSASLNPPADGSALSPASATNIASTGTVICSKSAWFIREWRGVRASIHKRSQTNKQFLNARVRTEGRRGMFRRK